MKSETGVELESRVCVCANFTFMSPECECVCACATLGPPGELSISTVSHTVLHMNMFTHTKTHSNTPPYADSVIDTWISTETQQHDNNRQGCCPQQL